MYQQKEVKGNGIIPAYHMNKQQWITVFLDGSVKKEQVFDLIDASFVATASAKKKQKRDLRRKGTERDTEQLKCRVEVMI